jgi:hypothetical protein
MRTGDVHLDAGALVSEPGFCQLLGPASRTARARNVPPRSIVVLEAVLLDDAIP